MESAHLPRVRVEGPAWGLELSWLPGTPPPTGNGPVPPVCRHRIAATVEMKKQHFLFLPREAVTRLCPLWDNSAVLFGALFCITLHFSNKGLL